MGTITGAIVVMSEFEESSDCYCGVCSTCRAEMRLMDRPASVAPGNLHPFAQKILRGESLTDSTDKPTPASARPVKKKTIRRTRKGTGYVQHLTVEEDKARLAANKRRSRDNLLAERIEIDGKMIHPRAPHGTVKGCRYYCCCCQPCNDAFQAFKRERRKGSA